MYLWLSRKNQVHTLTIQFQGPALLAYNDAEFSKADWKGIVSLGISGKEKDPLKVGRFGLGFKSIFHLTGRWHGIMSWSSLVKN